MQSIPFHKSLPFWICVLSILLGGCRSETPDFGSEHLIRVGERVVTVLDFNQAFELMETAHSFGLREDPTQLREAQQRLLQQMTIELLMLTRADELSLAVTAEEIALKIEEIKADYPEGTFEDALVEAAVPFDVWKQRLQVRLMVEKLVATELQDQMTITPKDISDHYQKYFKGKSGSGATGADGANQLSDHEALIRDLRRLKAEEAYNAWVEGLKARYPVEINAAVWEKLSAPTSVAADGGAANPTQQN